MSYRILIERIERISYTTREWVKMYDSPPPPDKEQYAYGPTVEKEKRETTKLLEQEVEGLDLKAVIRAVNGLV